jgi:hypothetical protein
MLNKNSSNAALSSADIPSRPKNSSTSGLQSSVTRRNVSVAPSSVPYALLMRLRACHADSSSGAKSSISRFASSHTVISWSAARCFVRRATSGLRRSARNSSSAISV